MNTSGMVRLCMAMPVTADPLDYASLDLAALTAFVTELHATTAPSLT